MTMCQVDCSTIDMNLPDKVKLESNKFRPPKEKRNEMRTNSFDFHSNSKAKTIIIRTSTSRWSIMKPSSSCGLTTTGSRLSFRSCFGIISWKWFRNIDHFTRIRFTNDFSLFNLLNEKIQIKFKKINQRIRSTSSRSFSRFCNF